MAYQPTSWRSKLGQQAVTTGMLQNPGERGALRSNEIKNQYDVMSNNAVPLVMDNNIPTAQAINQEVGTEQPLLNQSSESVAPVSSSLGRPDQAVINRKSLGEKIQSADDALSDAVDNRQRALAIKAGIGLASSLYGGPLAMIATGLSNAASHIFGGSGDNKPKEKDLNIYRGALKLSNILTDPNYYNDPANQVTDENGRVLSKQEAIQKFYHGIFETGRGSQYSQDQAQRSQFDDKAIQKILGQLGIDYETLKTSIGYDIPDFNTYPGTYADWWKTKQELMEAERGKRPYVFKQEGAEYSQDPMSDWDFWKGESKGFSPGPEKKQAVNVSGFDWGSGAYG